jgi:SAM-dependent methyltransferase
MTPPQYRELVHAAAALYRDAGRYPYYFACGKLGYDPVFPALLSRGLIPDGARVLDLGCGQGCLEALLIAARRQFDAGNWPAGWPAPPREPRLHGIELQDRVASWGRSAFAGRATIVTGDIKDATLPDADVVVILDVLHYLDRQAQDRVLARVARALRGDGLLLLRVGDSSAGLPFLVTRLADKVSTLLRGQGAPALHNRPALEWKALLEAAGFQVVSDPMSGGTPFANVLLTARLSPSTARPGHKAM